MATTISQAKKILRRKKKTEAPKQGLSTGLTLLNLAVSGNPNYGLLPGHYYRYVGDSSAGKTWFCMVLLAEASINPMFDEYDLIYDDIEGGALMDVEKYYGSRLASRLVPPQGTKKNPEYSGTVEQLYDILDELSDTGRKFIYIVDSMDSLTAEDDEKKLKKLASARKRKGTAENEAGTYGTAKAKLNSTRMRRLMRKLKASGSILVIISQTRDALGMFGFGEKKTVGGGHSLKFYATIEFWLKIREKLKKSVRGKNRQIGIRTQIQVKKNRVSGKDRTIFAPIYYSSGLDDVGSCVTWLIEEGHWTGTKSNVNAPEFDYKGSIEGLITQIQEEKERRLIKIVRQVWNETESLLTVERKNKYA